MITSVQDRFIRFIQENNLCRKGEKVLLAISGGSDSMVMCDLFIHTGIEVGLAHCNFQLRENDSDRDELFVKKYAEDHGIQYFSIRFNTQDYAREQKISIQEAARELRYNWFEKIRQEHQYHFIATAHHQNDHIETLLLNFFKGTGIHGLHGIPLKQGKVIRPLLFLSKKEILEYIATKEIHFVEDVSNLSEKYTRNYLRHQIIPALDVKFKGIETRLAENIGRFMEAGQLYDQAIDLHKKKLLEVREAEIFISILKLKKCKPLYSIVYEIFKPYNFSFEQARQVIRILDSEPGKVIFSSSHRVLRDRKWLIVSPLTQEGVDRQSHILIEKGQQKVDAGGLKLKLNILSAKGYKLHKKTDFATLDHKKMAYPLILRRWKEGDYFYPLGMRKKKKVSRFFIDQKLSMNDKDKVWVLEDSAGRIIWIVGLRIDDRFKMTTATREILQIEKMAVRD